MKSGAKQHFNNILGEDVARFLREHGFKKRNFIFSKSVGEVDWMVSFQSSVIGSSHRLDFTVNCGAYIHGIAGAYYAIDEPVRPSIEHCACYSRIGSLMPARKDIWWSVTDDCTFDSRASIAREIIVSLAGFGLPHLSGLKTGLDVVEALVSSTNSDQLFPPSRAQKLAYAGLICRKIGNLARAKQFFHEAVVEARGTTLEPIIERLLVRV